jgi:hypothetical protein
MFNAATPTPVPGQASDRDIGSQAGQIPVEHLRRMPGSARGQRQRVVWRCRCGLAEQHIAAHRGGDRQGSAADRLDQPSLLTAYHHPDG